MNDQLDDQPRLMTLLEAAEATGLTVEALRQRIKRGKLRAIRGNDRLLRVYLRPTELAVLRPDEKTGQPVGHQQDLTGHSAEDAVAIKALEGAIAALREAQERAEAQIQRERERGDREATARALAEGRAAAEAERAERAEKEAAALRRELEGWSAGGPFARALRALFWRRA